MGLPNRSYYHLTELMGRWSVTMADLCCFVVDGFLQVSTFTIGARVEEGHVVEAPDGSLTTIMEGYRTVSGLQPLIAHDAFLVFRHGSSKIQRFLAAEPDAYVVLERDGDSLLLTLDDLVVARVERDRFEAVHGLVCDANEPAVSEASPPTFVHNDSYTEVALHGEIFSLGPIQASIVRDLHLAAQADDPWAHQSVLLGAAQSSSNRLADVFKSKPNWQTLIIGDQRGKFRLNLPGRPARSGNAAYRRFGVRGLALARICAVEFDEPPLPR